MIDSEQNIEEQRKEDTREEEERRIQPPHGKEPLKSEIAVYVEWNTLRKVVLVPRELMTGTHTEHITQLLLNETIRQFT
jgi:hypothetical protein